MSVAGRLRRFSLDADGAAAIELALVLPLAAMMILGAIWVGLLTLTMSSLDYSVQAAARCAAVDAKLCGTAAATEAYAQKLYAGPAILPVFTADDSGCGHTVTGQADFDVSIVPGMGNVPLSVRACYP